MNWKKKMSIALTLFLITGSIPISHYTLYSHAEEVESSESGEGSGGGSSSEGSSGGSSSSDSSGGSSSGGSSSSDSSGGSSSGGSSSDSGGSSGGSSSSDSGGSSGGSSSSDSSSGSTDSESSSESTSSGSSETVTESDSSVTESSSDSSTESATSTTQAEETTAEEKEEKEEKKVVKKKVVEDDSKGRDYQDSELVSSGNTTFTIVSVSRNEEEINAKIKMLQEKLKKQEKEKDHYDKILRNNQQKIDDIQEIYTLLEKASDTSNHEQLLIGCKKEGAISPREDRVNGLDQALRNLAEKYNDSHLLEWTDTYTTEYLPQTFLLSTLEEEDSELISNADNVLQEMLTPSTTWIAVNQENIDNIQNSIDDTKEHIEKLEEAKKASTIDIDSRLVEYKEKIPDQCIEFLNAVVAKEGTPYVWGASGPNAFDCSGLVSYGLRQCGAVSSGFRWTSHDFATQIKTVSFSEAVPGDLVWKPGHIAIYIDENTVFEAPYTGAHIRFTACNVSSRFKRVLRWWSDD